MKGDGPEGWIFLFKSITGFRIKSSATVTICNVVESYRFVNIFFVNSDKAISFYIALFF